jgi:hypothetical protein
LPGQLSECGHVAIEIEIGASSAGL